MTNRTNTEERGTPEFDESLLPLLLAMNDCPGIVSSYLEGINEGRHREREREREQEVGGFNQFLTKHKQIIALGEDKQQEGPACKGQQPKNKNHGFGYVCTYAIVPKPPWFWLCMYIYHPFPVHMYIHIYIYIITSCIHFLTTYDKRSYLFN